MTPARPLRLVLSAVAFAALLACAPTTASAPVPAVSASLPAVPPAAAPVAPETVAPPRAAVGAAASPSLLAATRPLPLAADSRFIGLWQSHSFTLAVEPNGTGTAAWRTYRWCSSAAPPCDDLRASRITPGGRAALVLGNGGPTWVDAEVVETTDPASLPLGPARLVLRGAPLRLLVEPTALSRLPIDLCRADAARSTVCGA